MVYYYTWFKVLQKRSLMQQIIFFYMDPIIGFIFFKSHSYLKQLCILWRHLKRVKRSLIFKVMAACIPLFLLDG